MLIVVDDDDGIRVLLEELLVDRGYDVITAQNGAEGLDRIRREPRLSLLITDIRMPGIRRMGAGASRAGDARRPQSPLHNRLPWGTLPRRRPARPIAAEAVARRRILPMHRELLLGSDGAGSPDFPA